MATVISSSSKSDKIERATKRRSKQQAAPSEEEIRILAFDLYQRRQAEGADGDAASDWVEAERQLATSH
jgi:hypothetical protein